MANSYTATREATGVMPIYHPTGDVAVFSKFALTAALGAGDTIKMCKVPAFAVITDIILAADELDTGTGVLAYQVGDLGAAARFIAAAPQGNGHALAPVHLNVAAGLGYQYTADTDILVTVSTGPNTGASTGNVYLMALYSFEAITATSDGSEEP